jgi:putative SbcD/Mre11-related phosphoesterase
MQVHADWLLTPERAAIHRPTRTAVVADLHLGYAQVRRRGGEAVPSLDLDHVLAPLANVLSRSEIRRVVIAGDLCEDARLVPGGAELLHWFKRRDVELAGVVPGNHDRGLLGWSDRLPLVPDGICLGNWRVVHGDGVLPSGRLVLGHFHPCLRWPPRLTAPCYLVSEDQLVLPAFSADAAGVNVLGQRRWRRYRCCALAGDKVLDFGEVGMLTKRQKAEGRRQ